MKQTAEFICFSTHHFFDFLLNIYIFTMIKECEIKDEVIKAGIYNGGIISANALIQYMRLIYIYKEN